MAYAPTGNQPAVGCFDGQVHLLEAASLSLVQSVQYSNKYKGPLTIPFRRRRSIVCVHAIRCSQLAQSQIAYPSVIQLRRT